MNGWTYYNHAMIPSTYPHECVDSTVVESGEIWKEGGLFARWTTDFDCKNETSWWYVIKDDVFRIEDVKAKRRYEINKGRRYFDIYEVDPAQYVKELYQVQIEALSVYPTKYRNVPSYETFETRMRGLSENKKIQRVYAAFFRETNEICGYVHVPVHEKWAALSTLKVKPDYEKLAINAALIYGVLESLEERMNGEFYICDGPRNIQHETYFQDYLQKYFRFRKAYCKLHIKYRPGVNIAVRLIYPWRKILKKFGSISIVHKINGVLKMEEIIRNEES